MNQFILYAFTAFITVFVIYMFIDSLEQVISHIRHKIPLVPSTWRLRRAVVNEIRTNFPDMHTAVDIGSGYGGMARLIARKCKMKVIGLENMPFAATVSKIKDHITFTNGVKTIWCDAFEYLRNSDGFDIGIAYMGPGFNEDLHKYADKFQVLITLVIPADGLQPSRVVNLPRGRTRYGRHLYPHKLYIYDLRSGKK